jgi:hypothetical protein
MLARFGARLRLWELTAIPLSVAGAAPGTERIVHAAQDEGSTALSWRQAAQGGARTASGRLSRAIQHNPKLRDEGTKQFVAKRTAMVNGADPQLSATASGILLANGFLTKEQHTAALRYSWAHALTFGRVWGQISPLGEVMGAPANDMSGKAKKRLAHMDAKMNDEQRQAVSNVAVFNHIPNWFYVERLKLRELPEDQAERQALISGLDALG